MGGLVVALPTLTMDTNPRFGDSNNTLLFKISGAIAAGGGGGGGGGGVTSFNARTGAVSLLSADVTGALGYTPFSNQGGELFGPIELSNENFASGFNCVAKSNAGTLIAVGPGYVARSTDGTSWVLHPAAAENNWTGVAFGVVFDGFTPVNVWVAVANTGTGNRVMVSYDDGVTWEIQATGAADNAWTSITYFADLASFYAVASSGVGNRVMSSNDAETWVMGTSAADNNWTSIVASSDPAIIVAVASSGTGNRVMTSDDGVTWTIRTSAADLAWTSVAVAEGLCFVAVASSGTGNRVMRSTNGVTWTSETSASDRDWKSVTLNSNSGEFVAVASSGAGNRVMTSPDGEVWTSKPSSADLSWSGVANSGGTLVAVAANTEQLSSKVMISEDDGDTWTNVASQGITFTLSPGGFPIQGITGMAPGVLAFLEEPASTTLLPLINDRTGNGSLVFSISPSFTNGTSTGTWNVIGTLGSSATNVSPFSTTQSLTGSSSSSLHATSTTWNTSGSPILLDYVITNTASGANALFMRCRISNANVLTYSKDGTLVLSDTAGTVHFRLTTSTKKTEVVADPTGTLSFFGGLGAVKQTSGANLTNNVTSGGTDNQIDNYTSLTVYSTDAAAIRNNIYQLARKLKQVNDALRSYGMLS